MFYTSSVCCIHLFHIVRVSCCSESQGARGVMVARNGCWVRMVRGELRAGGRGARGACVGQDERPRIEADRAGCACEASRVDAWALRQDGCVCGGGNKISARDRLHGAFTNR
jgi:hypothetical protein